MTRLLPHYVLEVERSKVTVKDLKMLTLFFGPQMVQFTWNVTLSCLVY